jgi:rhomboid protease GluP
VNRIFKFIQVHLRLVYVLLGLNVLIFLITSVVAVLPGSSLNFALLFLGGEYTPLVLSGEVWRMVTSAFLHANIIHIALNMYAFLMVGNFIEKFYGRRKLLTIYIVTAVFGSIASIIADVVAFSSAGGIGMITSLSVGASGAIFGMIGVLIGNRFKRTPYEPQLSIDTNQLVTIVIYNLLIGVGLNLFSGSSFIDIWAHVGGLIGGLLLGVFLSGVNSFYIPKWKKIFENVLFIFAVILMAGSFIAEIVYIITRLFIP